MPLNLAALESSPGLPGASGRAYPKTVQDAAVEWAESVSTYTLGIVPPSTAHNAARVALEQALVVAFTPQAAASAAAALEQAFRAYAVQLAAGMLPAMSASVAPPGLVGFLELLSPPYPSSREAAIARLAARIDLWFRTGTATPIGSATPLPWS